jgi:hypothetical protein
MIHKLDAPYSNCLSNLTTENANNDILKDMLEKILTQTNDTVYDQKVNNAIF